LSRFHKRNSKRLLSGYDSGVASPSARRDLKALRNLINQADLVLATIPNPHASVASARESLNAALALSKDLVERFADPLKTGAAAMGTKGGSKTAERGAEYYSQIAAMRKNRRGGRPRKQPE
jgi:hypothetical protein